MFVVGIMLAREAVDAPSRLMMRGHSAGARRAADSAMRIEHGLKVEGRAADDVEHVAGRGLLLEHLGELVGARLHLLEQPHVLDRDHRLVGEGLDQLDLLLAEGSRSARTR